MNMTHKHNCNHMQTKLNHTQFYLSTQQMCYYESKHVLHIAQMYIICALWRGAIVNGPCAPVPSCVPLAPFNLNNS